MQHKEEQVVGIEEIKEDERQIEDLALLPEWGVKEDKIKLQQKISVQLRNSAHLLKRYGKRQIMWKKRSLS